MATGSHLAVNLQELEMLKREMPQQMPAGVQRSTSLDSMPPPAQPGPIPNNSPTDRPQQQPPPQPMTCIPVLHNSLASPPQACPGAVQRSRSLPLLDASQEIPPEILAQLTERENEQMMVTDVGQHSLQQQQTQEPQEHQTSQQQHQQHNINNSISDTISTCNSVSISNVVTNTSNMNNLPFADYIPPSQYRILTQSQLQQATQLHESAQPLNLSQTAEVRQILSQGFPPHHIQRVANFAGRQVPVGRDDLPQGLDWTSFQQAARYSIRPTEPRHGFPPSMLPPAIGQMPPAFNHSFTGRGIDTYGVGSSAEGLRYGMPGAMNPNLQKPYMPLSVFAQRHPFIKEEVGHQSPRDVSRVLNVPLDHADNNNDKSSPNMQAMSDGTSSNIADKNMMPLSVSVSVAFSEPSQDSPSFSQQSNSPALLKPAADQTLSMINYHEDHLLSDSGLMSNSPVPSTLDENFLNSTMIISTNSANRLGVASNLDGLDSNPPSVKMEGFDLFEGSGDVDEQNYITDSISPQSLSMEDSNQGLPHGMQAGHGNTRPLSQSGMNPTHSRGLDVAGPPQPGNNNGPLGDAPSQPRSRKGRPKVTGGQGHRYQQPCPTCGKVFGSSSALAKHKLIHSNERRHKCILCAKSFKRQDHLTGHMLTHRSKKPYECAVDNCGKSYCDIRSLRRHFESQHPGLVMEDNMTYTGDEKDPELIAAEAAAMQANRHNQAMMRGSPGADFTLGMGNPQDLNQSSSSQDTSNDSPGSSSSAALQSLALAAQRVQNIPDQSPNQGQLSSQDMSAIYRLDSYTSQMFGGNLPNTILSGGSGMATSIPGGPRELSIQVPNPRVPGLSLNAGVGLGGNGMLSHHSPGSARYPNQPGPDLGISPKGHSSSSTKGHRTHEKERITVECAVCKRTFKSMPALNGHMRLHGGYNSARADGSLKASPPKPEEKSSLPSALSHSQPKSLSLPPNLNNTINTHSQLAQTQGPQATAQHRLPFRMAGPASTLPTTMHLSSVYTNTTTSHVPSWPDYRHTRPHTVMSGKPASYLPNLPNLPLNMLQDELTTLAHTAVGLAAQSQAMQKPPVQIQQPPPQPPQHHPVHHTTSLPTERIQPYTTRLPIASKPSYLYNSPSIQIIPKEEPMSNPPTMLGSPSPPKLESMYRHAHEIEKQHNRSAEVPYAGQAMPPKLEAKGEIQSKDNVFRDPPPVQPSPTKKKSRPPSLFIPPWASTVTPGGTTPGTYTSQMRSPREIGVLYRSNSSTTPPPYTPPPMLSPIRSGTGLYFSVGSSGMPPATTAVTPKSAFPPSTPSMLQMHRRGSISASTDDSNFAFPSEPHINVGCDYQAALPDFIKNKEDVLDKPDWREGKLVWSPSIDQEYSEDELNSFVKLATTPSLPAGARNIEYAHHCLYRAKGDIEMALLMLLNGTAMVPEEDKHMSDYRYDFSQEWTVGERKLFRDMYKAKGKDFHAIAKGIPTKTVKDCVEYYYWWKKLYPYNHDMQKYCHHSGSNPNEEMRRNECDLYPGETFLDYVPLKEYRHDKYGRGATSNPKNNNSVKPSSNNQEDKPAAQQGPFVCNYPHCDASFKSRQALNGHIRVHGGSYKPNAATSNAPTNNQSRTTTSSSTTSSSYRGGGGVGQNTKQMPAETSSEEGSNDEEDEEESEEGSSRDVSENDQDYDDEGMTSEDEQEPRFPCRICNKAFDKVKSRNAHMKSHREPLRKEEMGYSGKEQQMYNHFMAQDSRSGSSSEEDEEEDDEEDMEGDDEGIDEEDDDMMSSEEDEEDDMSS